MSDFHAIHFEDDDEAAAFMAALSRFLHSPKGEWIGGDDLEVRAVRDDDEIIILLNDEALDATELGFVRPETTDCEPELVERSTLVIDGTDPIAIGRDDASLILDEL